MAAGLAFAGGRLRPGAFDAAAVARALALPLLLFGLAAAGLLCGGSPSPALAQGGNEEPRPTATPTPPVPKYRDILVGWTTDPNERLGPVSATFATSTAIKFKMVPPRDDWQLLYLDNREHQYDADGEMRWRCVSQSSSAIDEAAQRGRVFNYTFNPSYHSYLRGVVAADPDDDICETITTGNRANTNVAVLGDVYKVKTRIIYLTSGSPEVPGREPDVPPEFANAPTLRTVDDLIYQSPGGHWTTQMLVSFGAAVVVMIILRSMVGLMLGILLLPVTAYGMVLIGYGSYWYVLVMVLLFVFSVVAWGMAIRRA